MKKSVFSLILAAAIIAVISVFSSSTIANNACSDWVGVSLNGTPVVGAYVTIHDATCGCGSCAGYTTSDGTLPCGLDSGTYCVDASYTTGGTTYTGSTSYTFTSGSDHVQIKLQTGNHLCLPDHK